MPKMDDATVRIRRLQIQWSAPRGEVSLFGQPYVQAYRHRAARLLSGLRAQTGPESDVIAPLSDGGFLHVVYVPGKDINARAAALDELAVVGVMDGALRAIFETAAALWINPAVCPSVGDTTRLEPLTEAAFVSRGLEYVASQAIENGRGETPPPPSWINAALNRLCPHRRAAFERTIFTAIDFLLLHEVGHVLGGHLALIPRVEGVQAMAEFGFTEIIAPGDGAAGNRPDVLRALEIEADAYALKQIFAHAPERPNTPADMERRVAMVLGAIIPHLVFFVRMQLAERNDLALDHPPLWFRAREVLRAESYSRTNKTEHATVGAAQWDLSLAAALNTVGNTHPLFGQWLAPLTDPARDEPARRVIAEARRALDPFAEKLAAARRRFSMAPPAPPIF
jgi:hypothetical protein